MGTLTLWFLAYSFSIKPSWFMHIFTDIRISLCEQILVYCEHSPHFPSLPSSDVTRLFSSSYISKKKMVIRMP